jgi:hypothetical protein
MKSFLSLACLLSLVAMPLVMAAEEKPKGPKPQLAKKINSVTYEFTKGDKPEFVVTATTTVPTGGYKAQLERVTYVKPPEDGIQDYNLYLTKPTGIVTQALVDLKVSDRWQTDAAGMAWVKGVRVHGVGDGIVVKMLDKK